MAGLSEDRDRQVVPRWRSFASSLRHGDLRTLETPTTQDLPVDQLIELKADWAERRGISTAADLVSAAFVLGREAEIVDAAEFLMLNSRTPAGARGIAAQCLDRLEIAPLGRTTQLSFLDSFESRSGENGEDWRIFSIQIHEARSKLIEYPQNPVLWSDLARLYTSVGSHKKAARAMKVALAMAPRNRFILRASSRFFLHQGDRKEAHRVLTSADNLRFDPWILSAEIATAAATKKSSNHVRTARKLLESSNFSPHNLSELASALGTLEAIAGNRKAGRRLIAQSLRNPSENAIAQAAWLERNVGIGETLNSDNRVVSAEAGAWYALRDGDWGRSIEQAMKWWEDQPFSSRPAIQVSHIASVVLEDYELSARFARQGLLANPDDAVLSNNLAFALAMNGKTDAAMKELQNLTINTLPLRHQILVTATRGLIYFRSGNFELGRRYYQDAINLASSKNEQMAIIAQVYLAMEELRIGSDGANSIRDEAVHAARNIAEPWVRLQVSRISDWDTSPLKFEPGK